MSAVLHYHTDLPTVNVEDNSMDQVVSAVTQGSDDYPTVVNYVRVPFEILLTLSPNKRLRHGVFLRGKAYIAIGENRGFAYW